MGGEKNRKLKIALDTYSECVNCFCNSSQKNSGHFFAPREFLKYAEAKELIALKSGLKPAVGVRMPFEPKPYAAAKQWAKENSLKIGHTPFKYIINSNRDICRPLPLNSQQKGDVYVIIAENMKTIKRAADAYSKDVFEFGKIMGYPECCLEFGKSLSNNIDDPQKTSEDFIWSRANFRSFRNSKKYSFYLNVFSGVRVIPHTPCNLDCSESKKYARQMLSLMGKENQSYRKSTETILKSASLFWGIMEHVLLDGKFKEKKFFYTESMPFLLSSLFYAEADTEKIRLLKLHYNLITKGNALEITDSQINIFKDEGKIGIIPKKAPHECILTVPSEEK